jgi:TIM-barrel protein
MTDSTTAPTSQPAMTTTPVETDSVRLGLASLSGEVDAAWAKASAGHTDIAFLGRIALDAKSRAAARALVARNRSEFLPPDPLSFVDEPLSALTEVSLGGAINVRSARIDPVREAASVAANHGAVFEINAHCRQAEPCAVGCGESLLADTARLCEHVAAAAATGATTCVKVRAEVPGVDLTETTRRIAEAEHGSGSSEPRPIRGRSLVRTGGPDP